MAAPGEDFGAHECGAAGPRQLLELGEGTLELGGVDVVGVGAKRTGAPPVVGGVGALVITLLASDLPVWSWCYRGFGRWSGLMAER